MKYKTKIVLVISIIIFVLLIGLLIVTINQKHISSNCSWEPGECKNICTSENYFFSSIIKKCGQYIELSSNGGCCTPPPFETLEECQLACE